MHKGARRLGSLIVAASVASGAIWLAGGAGTVAALASVDTISGVVQGPQGGEAGVWVIAETDDLETTFRKIVVTGDGGRFLVPDLPDGEYAVWSRGYGLRDSAKQQVTPGAEVVLAAEEAGTAEEAAALYPANYWYALLDVPPASEFPGTGEKGMASRRACATRRCGSTD